MKERLYHIRFQLFFFTQIAILFGSLLVPAAVFDTIISPLLFLGNIVAGILLISRNRRLYWFFIAVLIIEAILFSASYVIGERNTYIEIIRMTSYFLFYTVVTIEIIMQVWNEKIVDHKTIFGLISGYLSLGLLGFFVCLSVQLAHPGSFTGIPESNASNGLTDSLLYYSYITLMTIGYGDILPTTALARKASVFIGLMGQFYLVIITAIVVGKFINQASHKSNV